MSKAFEFGFMLGRFQHMHIGHEHVIDKGLAVCENLLILVGSSNESGTKRNPFNVKTRVELIKQVYGHRVFVGFIPDLTNEDDHSHEWGDYIIDQVSQWKTLFGIKYNPDLMLYGNDEERSGWFRPEHRHLFTELAVTRGTIDISATKMREYLVNDEQAKWEQFANKRIHEYYGQLRQALLQLPGGNK